MPFLFLSPSTQEFNPYVTTGNEEYWMNLLADEMTPYLLASGVNVTRNDPNANAAAAIRASNAGSYDFHLALHSNASGVGNEGGTRGIDVYYYPTSRDGLRMANLLVDALKPVYPLPDRVRALPTTSIGEVRRTTAPAVLAELGYHDNPQDAVWIEENLPVTAQAIALAVTQYFGLPFLTPTPVRDGTMQENAALRAYPEPDAPVYRSVPEGAEVRVLGGYDAWYTAEYGGTIGFLPQRAVALSA